MKHLKLLTVKVTGEAGSILELPNIFLDNGNGTGTNCCNNTTSDCDNNEATACCNANC